MSISFRADGGCGFWQPTGGLTVWVVWPGLRVGSLLASFHTYHMNRVNSQIVIIIIIIIINKLLSVV